MLHVVRERVPHHALRNAHRLAGPCGTVQPPKASQPCTESVSSLADRGELSTRRERKRFEWAAEGRPGGGLTAGAAGSRARIVRAREGSVEAVGRCGGEGAAAIRRPARRLRLQCLDKDRRPGRSPRDALPSGRSGGRAKAGFRCGATRRGIRQAAMGPAARSAPTSPEDRDRAGGRAGSIRHRRACIGGHPRRKTPVGRRAAPHSVAAKVFRSGRPTGISGRVAGCPPRGSG